LTAGLRGAWEQLFFRSAAPLGPIGARTLLCANALWIVLSRPDLADLPGWPPELWARVPPGLRCRYFILPVGTAIEQVAYGALCLALVAGLLGLVPRLSCFVAASLLYHFAPFEEILTTSTGPYLGGLTLPVLGLFILSFARTPALGSEPSPEHRWPLALVQMLLAFRYLFAGVAKLTLTGPGWMSVENVEATALLLMTYETRPPWGHWLVDHPALALAAGVGTVALELSFIGAVFSRRAAWVVMPAALALDLLAFQTLGVAFLNAPLLLLLLDWDGIDAWWRARRGREPRPAVSGSRVL
jgi:hypothetical protein